uniref:Uncharacterized protein n=1 Tax=Trypanosoma vivax (strain Y486) TaxID=1055687 RepID=G0U607_TRYVY|nr:hypothetical protein, conserved in T. vivax [Trypanosoma vivax Y486]
MGTYLLVYTFRRETCPRSIVSECTRSFLYSRFPTTFKYLALCSMLQSFCFAVLHRPSERQSEKGFEHFLQRCGAPYMRWAPLRLSAASVDGVACLFRLEEASRVFLHIAIEGQRNISYAGLKELELVIGCRADLTKSAQMHH